MFGEERSTGANEMSRRRWHWRFLGTIGALSGLLLGQGVDDAAMSRQAKAAMQYRQFEEAERIYQELLERHPQESGLILNLALAQYSLAKYTAALPRFRRFVEIHPEHGSAWLLLGVTLQMLERPVEAVDPLKRAVDLAPRNRTARLELADAFLRSGRPVDALRGFVGLARLEPGNSKIWLGMGLSYTELSREAAEELERRAPRSAFYALLLAHSALAQEHHRAAFSYFRAALAADPEAPEAHEAIASIYREIGQADWAEVELRKRPRESPCRLRPLECLYRSGDFDELLNSTEGRETPQAWYWRARAFGEKARQAHERLLELPPSAAAYWLLASIEDLAGRASSAATAWRQAIDLEPNNPALRRNRLRSLRLAGQHEETMREADELLRLRSGDGAGLFYSGDARLQLGRLSEAIPLLESAVRADGRDEKARSSLATAYLRAGRGGEAIPHLEEVLAEHEDASALFQLSRAYQAAGRRADAAAALARRQRALGAQNPSPVRHEITPP